MRSTSYGQGEGLAADASGARGDRPPLSEEQASLVRAALARLAPEDAAETKDSPGDRRNHAGGAVAPATTFGSTRWRGCSARATRPASSILVAARASCSLCFSPQATSRIIGLDASPRALERAADRLKLAFYRIAGARAVDAAAWRSHLSRRALGRRRRRRPCRGDRASRPRPAADARRCRVWRGAAQARGRDDAECRA